MLKHAVVSSQKYSCTFEEFWTSSNINENTQRQVKLSEKACTCGEFPKGAHVSLEWCGMIPEQNRAQILNISTWYSSVANMHTFADRGVFNSWRNIASRTVQRSVAVSLELYNKNYTHSTEYNANAINSLWLSDTNVSPVTVLYRLFSLETFWCLQK